MRALNNDRLPITELGIGMARDDFIDGEFCAARSNWSFCCKASRSGWATSAGSCRLACCPQNVLTAAQFGVHGGCVLNWCGVRTGTHRLRSSNTCVDVRAREAGTRGLTTNRPPLTKSHPFE